MFQIDRTQFRFQTEEFAALEPGEVSNLLRASAHRIDGDILASNASLRNEITGLWGTVENYLRNGVGWVSITDDQRIMGRCNAAFVGGGLAEISVGLDKSVRGAGLGYYLAQKCIQDCLHKNLTPNWTCDTLNTPSFQLAQKLGFVPERPYFLFTSVYSPMFHEPARQRT